VVAYVALAMLVSGCSAPLAGSDAALYSGGTLRAVVNRDITAVYQASVQALQHLEIDIQEQAKDVFAAKVVGKAADDKQILITIRPGETNRTNFTIKVSGLASEERARLIYAEIRKGLSMPE
jgi:hypothetical protein